ncbi:hypothetical protein M139_2201 [Bacteroides fragilis str. S23L24]|nr:hypothetical protein M139_2201 [Bacteroides fragilis str. S23L24]EYE45024.1 hypothetical protein M138_2144 [Bacteroides fragilis str. S23L17]
MIVPILVNRILNTNNNLSATKLATFPYSYEFRKSLNKVSLSLCTYFTSVSTKAIGI